MISERPSPCIAHSERTNFWTSWKRLLGIFFLIFFQCSSSFLVCLALHIFLRQCLLYSSFLLNDLLHGTHLNFLTSEWVSSCPLRWSARRNRSLQAKNIFLKFLWLLLYFDKIPVEWFYFHSKNLEIVVYFNYWLSSANIYYPKTYINCC